MPSDMSERKLWTKTLGALGFWAPDQALGLVRVLGGNLTSEHSVALRALAPSSPISLPAREIVETLPFVLSASAKACGEGMVQVRSWRLWGSTRGRLFIGLGLARGCCMGLPEPPAIPGSDLLLQSEFQMYAMPLLHLVTNLKKNSTLEGNTSSTKINYSTK